MSGGGERQGPGLALQQRHIEGLLQTLEPTGNRRLGNAKVFRRLIQRGKLHGSQQSINVIDTHTILNVIFAY